MDAGHGDVVQHGFGTVGSECRHDVHPLACIALASASSSLPSLMSSRDSWTSKS